MVPAQPERESESYLDNRWIVKLSRKSPWRMKIVITLRKDQMDAFENASRREFEDQIVADIRGSLAEQFNSLGEAEVRRLIRLGVNQSARYGIVGNFDVQRYIYLMLKLTPDFDKNAATAWARPILTDTATTPEGKLDQIEGCAILSVATEGNPLAI